MVALFLWQADTYMPVWVQNVSLYDWGPSYSPHALWPWWCALVSSYSSLLQSISDIQSSMGYIYYIHSFNCRTLIWQLFPSPHCSSSCLSLSCLQKPEKKKLGPECIMAEFGVIQGNRICPKLHFVHFILQWK